MKYIIMCGGKYRQWETPRQLLKINGEAIINRTIRLLRENDITDIAISTDNPAFECCGVPLLKHNNTYDANGYNDFKGYWCDAFYPTKEPCCYIFGDVVFSPEAMRIIVQTDTKDIEFFASAPPFGPGYFKDSAEPFALKVQDPELLQDAIRRTKLLDKAKKFKRKPIMWELWQVIKNTALNHIDYTNYTVINDYTCDIDYPDEVSIFEDILKGDT
jgi:hypothetical protein